MEQLEFSYDGEEDIFLEESDFQIEEYDLTSSPNDFNVLTINSFIDSGSIKIPGFQRNYVWDIKRASKLIESLILGLPIPQIFLYEERRNQFLVIDGQQRLMTVYFFVKGRFPKKEKRTDIRRVFNASSTIPENILFDDTYFTNFRLSLTSKSENSPNPFNGLNYQTLGGYKMQVDLRPIRCIVVKQNVPKDDNSSVYEIFNRLNSGGINLTPQEIRASLYHSPFMDMLFKLNMNRTWRKFLRSNDPDLHMKDIELLLRSFALALNGDNYTSSLAKFLNKFANDAKKIRPDQLQYYEMFFLRLLDAISHFPDDTFINKVTRRFNAFLFEGLIYAVAAHHFPQNTFQDKPVDLSLITSLASDSVFQQYSIRATTNKDSVTKRLERAKSIIRI